jgi:hypothetical protein
MRMLHSILAIAGAVALPLAAHAQDSTATTTPRSPAVGERVLVTLAGAEGYEGYSIGRMPALSPRFVGRVVQVTSESLYVQPHPSLSVVAVPQAAARHVYVSRGRPRAPSMAWGAAEGALLGAGMGLAAVYPMLGRSGSGSRPENRVTNFALWTVSGVISGAITGAMSPAERWRRIR